MPPSKLPQASPCAIPQTRLSRLHFHNLNRRATYLNLYPTSIITAPQTTAKSRRLNSKYMSFAPSECTRCQGSHPRHNRPYRDVDPSPENHRQRYSTGSVAYPPRGSGGACQDLRVPLVILCLDHHEHLVNVFPIICTVMEAGTRRAF